MQHRWARVAYLRLFRQVLTVIIPAITSRCNLYICFLAFCLQAYENYYNESGISMFFFSSSTPLPRSRTRSQPELIIHPALHTAYSISEFFLHFITQISTVLLICTSSLINYTVCFESCECRFLVTIAIHNAVSNASRWVLAYRNYHRGPCFHSTTEWDQFLWLHGVYQMSNPMFFFWVP